MACINKKNPSYLKLSEKFGDVTAEAAVRKMTADKNLGNDFYIPSIEEVQSLINNSTKGKKNNIKPGVEELFDSNFLIFVEAKNAEEVITKLINNNVIEKKCS